MEVPGRDGHGLLGATRKIGRSRGKARSVVSGNGNPTSDEGGFEEMRSFAILSLGVLVMLPVLEPGGFAQAGFPQRRNVDPNNQPGLEVPVVTPGPGWKACPRC